MIRATDWFEDHYGWGDVITFHSIEVNGVRFPLESTIEIHLTNGSIKQGKISFIKETSVDILSDDGYCHRILFTNVQNVC